MNLADALKNLKEFFLEFLGYFLPGFTLFFLLGIILPQETINVITENIAETKINSSYIFLFLAYVLGYVIYGADIVRKDVGLAISKKYPKLTKWIKKYLKLQSRQDIEKNIFSTVHF